MKTQIEIVPQMEITVKASGLLPERALPLVAVFQPLAITAAELFTRADAVTDREPKKAREVRLDLAKVRIAVEKLRKAEKSESLKLGAAVDSVAKVIFSVIEPYETKMEAIEKAEEIAVAKAKAERAEARRLEIAPLGVTVEELLLVEMNPDAWASFVAGTKASIKQKQEEESAALEKAMREKEEREERDRKLREENERLKKLAAEADRARVESEAKAKAEREKLEAKARKQREADQAKAAAERAVIERKAKSELDAAEAAARKERAEREKLDSEKREREEAEHKRLKAEAAAKAKAARAPDRDKLLAFLKEFTTIKSPDLKSDESQAVLKRFAEAHGAAIKAALQDIENL